MSDTKNSPVYRFPEAVRAAQCQHVELRDDGPDLRELWVSNLATWRSKAESMSQDTFIHEMDCFEQGKDLEVITDGKPLLALALLKLAEAIGNDVCAQKLRAMIENYLLEEFGVACVNGLYKEAERTGDYDMMRRVGPYVRGVRVTSETRLLISPEDSPNMRSELRAAIDCARKFEDWAPFVVPGDFIHFSYTIRLWLQRINQDLFNAALASPFAREWVDPFGRRIVDY